MVGMACLEAAGINGELDGDWEELRLDLGFRRWGKQRGNRGDRAAREWEQRRVEGPLVQQGAGGATSRPTERQGGAAWLQGRRGRGERLAAGSTRQVLNLFQFFLFLIFKQQDLAI